MTIESSSAGSSSVESRHPLDILRTLANNLETKDIGLHLFHCHREVGVQARDTTSKSNPYAYCTSITGLSLKLTTLQLSVTPDKNTMLNNRDPLKTRTLSVSGEKWSFYPDKSLGKRTEVIGIFSGVHPASITWELTAKTVSEITTTTTKNNTNIQVQMKPIRMDYTTNYNICNTTALTVYAPIEYLAEVKGACIGITHNNASHSLGLNRGKFHGAQAIARTRGSLNVILASHDNTILNTSMILLRVEAPEWSMQVNTDECREILAISYNDRNHTTTVFLLFQ